MVNNTNNRFHPSIQFIIFFSLTIGIVGAGYLVGVAAVIGLYGVNTVMDIAQLNLSNPNAANALWIIQIVSTTIPILAASVIFAKWVEKDSRQYLKTTFKIPFVLLVVILCIMVISSPLIEFLSNINQKMVLPHYLAGLQQRLRNMEDQAQKLTAVLLQMPTVLSFIFKLLVVGLLTAIVEEFMFRGCIQTIFTKWTNNKHAAIWITAILFSAFHMEFFGFLPRMMLGVLFGYFVAWSGSIWTAVWGHFINNGTAVIMTYLFQHKKISLDPDDQHIFNYAGYVVSLIIVLFLLYLYRNIATDNKQVPQN